MTTWPWNVTIWESFAGPIAVEEVPGRSVGEYVRDLAKDVYGEVESFAINGVEVDGTDAQIKVGVRLKAEAQEIAINVVRIVPED